MHKKLWCSSVFTVFWVLITLWWPLGSSAPLVRDICQAELTWLLHHSALHSSHRYYNITILFCFAVCLSAVRPSQWLTNNWTKFWQFICSYLFLCQCCCQLFYFWSASVNSSFMARQPSSQGLLYFACMAELSWADWPKCFCPANPPATLPDSIFHHY